MKQVTAAIIIDDAKVLLTRRGPDDKLAGYWEFPGGKVEAGEGLQECVVRELEEELSLIVEASKILTSSHYQYEHGEFDIIAIEATIISGEITLSVHDLYEWVPIDSLLSRNLLPADIPIAKFLIKND